MGTIQEKSNNTMPAQNENMTDRQHTNGLATSFGSLPTINDFKYVKNPGQGKKKKHSKEEKGSSKRNEGDRKREPNTPATPMKSTRGQNGNSMYTSIVMGDSTNYHVSNNQFSGSRLPSRGSPSEQLFTFTNKGKIIGSKRYVTKII